MTDHAIPRDQRTFGLDSRMLAEMTEAWRRGMHFFVQAYALPLFALYFYFTYVGKGDMGTGRIALDSFLALVIITVLYFFARRAEIPTVTSSLILQPDGSTFTFTSESKTITTTASSVTCMKVIRASNGEPMRFRLDIEEGDVIRVTCIEHAEEVIALLKQQMPKTARISETTQFFDLRALREFAIFSTLGMALYFLPFAMAIIQTHNSDNSALVFALFSFGPWTRLVTALIQSKLNLPAGIRIGSDRYDKQNVYALLGFLALFGIGAVMYLSLL